jgi:hypothetical protein
MNLPLLRGLLLLSLSAFAAAASETPGATAHYFSSEVIEGLKLGIEENEGVTDAFRRCIREVPEDGVALAYQQFLTTTYRPEEIAEMDAFIASPLGLKLQAYSRYRFRMQHGLPVSEPVTLSPEETRGLDAFGETPTGRKFVELYTQDSNPPDHPQTIAMQKLMDDCRRTP